MGSRSSTWYWLACAALVGCGDGGAGPDLAAPHDDLGSYMCTPNCGSDAECANTCAPATSGASCCDAATRKCFHSVASMCPAPSDLASLVDQSVPDLASSPADLAKAPADLALPIPPDLSVRMCTPVCTTHDQCANSCAPPLSGRSCCDTSTNSCFTATSALCPEPTDLAIIGPY